MDRAMVRIVLACALTVAVGSVASAQSSQASANAQGKSKKHANQVPDTGQDASTPDPSGDQFDRVIENVPVTLRDDGTAVAELDESFMEATTVTVDASGSLRFDHFTGLARAARAVREQAANGQLLPARPLPQVFPILEDKE
jgi:hypothetical protein